MTTQFIRRWIAQRRWLLIALGVLNGLILLFGQLFAQERAVFFYLLQLSLVSAIVLAGMDLWQAYRHYQQIVLKSQQYPQDLSVAHTSEAEQFLWELLLDKQQGLQQLTQQMQTNYHEQLDYYTLWAHQIKTPISAALLLTQQLPTTETSTLLNQELFKIQQYTDFVLHYLRMETFNQDLSFSKESLQSLIAEVLKKYATFFIQKSLSVSLIGLDHLFVTDKKWFLILTEQLISNAIKYTTTGTITIQYDGGILSIQDTGIGIHAADIPRIFERGFTGFNGRFSQQSSGLGLYLTKEIAQRLGYSLTVTSQVNQGTTISLDISQTTLPFD